MSLATADLEVGTPHGVLRLGRDAAGQRHLLVPLGPGDRMDNDVRSAGVHLSTRTLVQDDALPIRYADLACRRGDLAGVFTGLVSDLVALIAREPSRAPSQIVRALQSWRILLGGDSRRWTIPRLAGLFAELLVLRDLLEVNPQAICTWMGPLGCPQDFRSVHHAIEVKSSMLADGRVAHIHGADQLEAPAQGTLALAWLRIAESKESSALSVPELVDVCRASTEDLISLEIRLAALSLPGDDEGLTQSRFLATEQLWFDVSEDFPRITSKTFVDDSVPTGVHGLEYKIDLDAVSNTTEQEKVLQRLGADL